MPRLFAHQMLPCLDRAVRKGGRWKRADAKDMQSLNAHLHQRLASTLEPPPSMSRPDTVHPSNHIYFYSVRAKETERERERDRAGGRGRQSETDYYVRTQACRHACIAWRPKAPKRNVHRLRSSQLFCQFFPANQTPDASHQPHWRGTAQIARSHVRVSTTEGFGLKG